MARSRKHRRVVTSQDVADYAGVSRATVSAVINKTRYVSEDLIEKVEAAVKALQYKPNVLARGLKTQRTNTLGLLIPNVLSPVWTLITHSVEMRARELGFNTIICDTDEVLETERTCVNLLLARQVDGIIIAPCSINSEDYLSPLIKEKPFVFIDRQPHQLEVDYVTPDKAAGTYAAVLHLVEQGLKRVAIVLNTNEGQEDFLDSEWLGGYKQALHDCGLPIAEDLIQVGRRGSYSESDGYSNAKQLMQLAQPPEAILACTHFTTMGVLRAARELGIHIPTDLALVGFEDVLYMDYIHPPVTVVSQPWDVAGQWAVDTLVQRLRAEDNEDAVRPVEHHILPVHLIIRKSSVLQPFGTPHIKG